MKQKHLTLEERETIEDMLKNNFNFVNGKIKCRNSVKKFVGFPTFSIC